MNGKDLLDKMSDVDPKLIEDAENASETEKPRKKHALFIGITSGMATVAAALAVAAVIRNGAVEKPPVAVSDPLISNTESTITSNGESTITSDGESDINSGGEPATHVLELTPEPFDPDAFAEYGELPKVSTKKYDAGGGGMGAGRTEIGLYSVYKGEPMKELESHSPWSLDAELTTMPVFLSNSTRPDVDKMYECIKRSFDILGIPQDKVEYSDDKGKILAGSLDEIREYMEKEGYPQDEIDREIERLDRSTSAATTVEGEAKNVWITHGTSGTKTFWFREPYPEIPAGCSLDGEAPAEQKLAAVEYLAEQ